MEELVEVIDENLKTIDIVPRNEVIEKKLRHKCALVLVRNNKGEFYLAQRKKTKKVFPGLWCAGAGGVVSKGESFEVAAARELEEELGIKVPLQFLCNFDYQGEVGQYKAKLFLALYDGEVEVDPVECEQGKWVSEEGLSEFFNNNWFAPDTALFFKKYLDEKDL